MGTVILLVVVFIAFGFVVDSLRRKTSAENNTEATPLTADEALPTQTGRFRVKEALGGYGLMKPSTQEVDRPAPCSLGPAADTSALDKFSAQDELPDPFNTEVK